MSVSVIILNWNGEALLEKFLPSVIANTPTDLADIVVVDNGSTDDSVNMLKEKFPSVKLIILDKNHGFAEGYNLALSQIESTYSVLLNSDVEVTSHWLDAPIQAMEADPNLAGVQPKILDYKDKRKYEYAGAAGGWIDRYGYPLCRGRILNVVEEDTGQYDSRTDIFWASGACLFVRTDVFKKEGGLDARFFAHQEEIDLCWRLRSRGYRLECIPQSVVYHVGGATLKVESPQKTFLNFRNNLLMVYKNLAADKLQSVMFIRFLLDYLAMAKFMLTGNFQNAIAIVRARIAYRRLKRDYAPIRAVNLSKTVVFDIPEMLRQSVILNFYFKGKTKFSAFFK
ncbi:MAG: glycosyltransferase family 2 protein [Tannerella sp.]|nr:glycosyltransferase family 2 protein [Tannerella sp.]